MPNRGDRGGSVTRARIAEVATELFLRDGFESVTVADVAAAAGVSKVTVFSYFERKEDLLLDDLPLAVELLRSAIRDRPVGRSAVGAVRDAAVELSRCRHGLSGLMTGFEPFMRTVAASPALINRYRSFAFEIEAALAEELRADDDFTGDSELTAALLVAAYRTVTVETHRARTKTSTAAELDVLARTQVRRLNEAFDVIERGLQLS